MTNTPLIIERPDLQSAVQKYGWTSLTLLFWALYVYMWLPLISLLMWAMGGNFIYEHMIVLGGYVELLQTWGWYSLVIAGLGLTLLAWARFNYWRFRGIERRRAATEVSTEQQAMHYAVSADELAHWQTQGNLTVHMNAEGQIIKVGVNSAQEKPARVQVRRDEIRVRRFTNTWQAQRPRFAKPVQPRLLSRRSIQLPISQLKGRRLHNFHP